MQRLRAELPPLELLIAFEAAARRSSFTRAAEELNITQSAVSQQIRGLEASLGLELFERGHRSVRLSAAGQEFYNSVSLALAHLQGAASRVRIEKELPKLTIATDRSFAAMWLAPRLGDFRNSHPRLVLQLIASDEQEDCFREEVDLAIIHGDGAWPGYECRHLFDEEVFPVCSPDHLRDNPAIASLEGLRKAMLLDLEYESWSWMNWSIWFREMGAGAFQSQELLRSNDYPLLIDCAKQGQGVALGWRRFVDDDIAGGRLVTPVPLSVSTAFAYHLLWRHNQPVRQEAQAFEDWLLSELERQRLCSL